MNRRILQLSFLLLAVDAFQIINNNKNNNKRSVVQQKVTRSVSSSVVKSSNNNRISASSLLCTENEKEQKGDGAGLYRPFLEYAWSKLSSEDLLVEGNDQSTEYTTKSVKAKGNAMPNGTQVKITIDAKMGTSNSPITYARYALLETIVPNSNTTTTTKGIQVLNLVLFAKSCVWGVDLVSLPTGKHLLAIDTQPMSLNRTSDMKEKYEEWYSTYVDGIFPCGGDLSEATRKFFSSHVLWTRISDSSNTTTTSSIELIQTKLMVAFQTHLDLYLSDIQQLNNIVENNHLEEYLEYRLQNDPARPMLQSLYGKEWTEEVLETILFPKNKLP